MVDLQTLYNCQTSLQTAQSTLETGMIAINAEAEFGKLMDMTSTGCQTLGTVFGAIGDSWGNPVGEPPPSLQEGMSNIVKYTGELLINLKSTINGIIQPIAAGLSAITTLISRFASLAGDALAVVDSLISRLVDSLATGLAPMLDAAANAFSAVANQLSTVLSIVDNAVGQLVSAASDVVTAVANAGCGLIAAGLTSLTGVDAISPAADQIVKNAAGEGPYYSQLGNIANSKCSAADSMLGTGLTNLQNGPQPPTILSIGAIDTLASDINAVLA